MKQNKILPSGRRLLQMLSLFLVLALMLPGAAFAASADDVVGTWLTVGGKSKVQISKVGGKYVGKLVWLKDPKRNGKDKTDLQNPNKSLQGRKLMGLSLLDGFTYSGGKWVNGTIYNPLDGKTYSCELTLQAGGKQLNVRGYVLGMTALGKTQVWTATK